MVQLDDEARSALRIRGLRELLVHGDGVREAVDDHIHSALTSRVIRPPLPHLVPAPDRLGGQRLQKSAATDDGAQAA
jgi:hypothetical protein